MALGKGELENVFRKKFRRELKKTMKRG